MISKFLIGAAILGTALASSAQEVPTDYQQVLKTAGKSGDYKQNVLKVNVPRNVHMTIADNAVPTPFGFGG